MSGGILWIAVIFVLVGSLVYMAIEGDINPVSIAQKDLNQLTQIIKDTRCNQVGDCIDVWLQPQAPISDEIFYEGEPEGQRDLELEQNSNINNTNGSIPIISKTFIDARCIPNPSNPYDPCDDKSLADKIQIGNVVHVAGTVRIVDPLSLDPLNPNFVNPPFKYSVEIYCDFRDFCITSPIARRGITDSIGNFDEKWTTSQTNSGKGEYIAKITSWSIIDDPFGRPYLVENEYRFELF